MAGDREFAAQLAEAQLPTAKEFVDRYRLTLALAAAAPSAQGDGWLAAQSAQAEEWMARSTALSALVQRGAVAVPTLAEAASRDAYPRVRANALGALLAAGQAARVESLLAADPWPLVRVEAAHVLAARSESRPVLEQAVSDRSRLVRRAAIDALTAGQQRASWPSVGARLDDESLEVREASIEFARQLCVQEARPALLKAANKSLSPDASEEDSTAAVEALRALHELGGPAADDGAGVVRKEGGPELRKLWDGLPPARCQRTPQS